MEREFSVTPMQITWRGPIDEDDERWADFRGRILDEWDGVPHRALDRARGDWDAIVSVIREATGEDRGSIASKLEGWSVAGEIDPPEEDASGAASGSPSP